MADQRRHLYTLIRRLHLHLYKNIYKRYNPENVVMCSQEMKGAEKHDDTPGEP